MKKGCLIGLVLVALLAGYAWRQIGEPARRAAHVREQIRPGMTCPEVEGLLTGRYYCFYEVLKGDSWGSVSRDDFAKVQGPEGTGAPAARRLNLVFMGLSPGRVSVLVQVDKDGKVAETTVPRGWD